MKLDLLVKNAKIVTEDKVISGGIGVKDGRITAIGQLGSGVEAKEVFDAEGRYLFPGAIDTHPHFFDPGAEWREDFWHGTCAAASGGFTTVLDMPNTSPPVKDKKTFLIKKERAEKKCLVDYAFWGAAMPGNIDELEQLKQMGCIAFKAFTIEAAPDFQWSDEYDQLKEMSKIAALDGIYGAHAENPVLIRHFTELYRRKEWTLEVHNASRPPEAELTALNTLLLYAKLTGCKLHICHLSIPEGACAIAKAKEEGVSVTAETCAHYLTLNYEDNAYLGTFGKINPPLRDRGRMEKMWQYVLDGTIDYLGTDHAPYLKQEKIPDDRDFRKAACGAPEIDIAIPLLLEEGIKKRDMSPMQFAAFTAGNAAKRFGLYPKKGTLSIGSDADFYIADLNCDWHYTRKKSFSKSKETGFAHEGERLSCRITATFLRGECIFADGKILRAPGFGRFLFPACADTTAAQVR